MTSTRREGPAGFALIAVLVALSLLLALAAPFLLSMGHGDAQTRAIADEKHVEMLSASARDIVLARAKLGAFAIEAVEPDGTPVADGRDEYPDRLELPEAFSELTRAGGGRNALQAEAWDLQRKIDVNTASPLLLANLLGLSVRLSQEHEPDAEELSVVGDTTAFPDSGLLLVDREVIGYRERDGSTFRGLSRGLLAEFGFLPPIEHGLGDGELVLDLRVVAAWILPVQGDGDPTTRRPYAAVRELARIESLSYPPFSPEELDLLERHCTADAMLENAARWGKPERVFEIRVLEEQNSTLLQVRSAASLGGGTLARVRSADSGLEEYAFVIGVAPAGDRGAINLPRRQYLRLLTPLTLPFRAIDCWIEPLVPTPVNVNTADREVLAALLAHLRRRPGVRSSGDHARTRAAPPYFAPRQAAELADEIVALRQPGPVEDRSAGFSDQDGAAERRPFDGWEDFATRWVIPKAKAATSMQERRLWMLLYESLRIGRSAVPDMGTAPAAFHSAPLVGYRASAARYRLSGIEAARLERQGVAIVNPGQSLFWGAATQEQVEEFIRLDRRTPYWLTYPINTSAILPADRGTVPALRTPAHLLAPLFPDAGFGEARFPDREGAEGAIRAQPSSTPFRYRGNEQALESFMTSRHPEGRDVVKEGAYELINNGPRAGAAQGAARAAAFDHAQTRFPFTTTGGLTSRHAVRFWFKLESLEPQALYDLAAPADVPERNRIALWIKDQKLVFEVLDDAGLDPDPSQSKGAVERSAGTWELPLEEYSIEPQTWYHVSLSALGNRPGQLTVLVDGVPRGDAKHRTYLQSAIDVYAPDRNAQSAFEDRGRFQLQIRVEDTEGFPEQGVLRIGLELFEYSSKDSNTFYCVYDNSVGGRAARVAIHEFQIQIPRDESGDPREDLLKIVNRADATVTAPDHPVGAAVELYGYSVPVYPGGDQQYLLQPGSAQLTDALGAFAIARVINSSNTATIAIQAGNFTVNIGRGLDETWQDDLELGDPIATKDFPPGPARDDIASAFPQSGGFALLVQRRIRWSLDTLNAGQLSEPVEIGGVELIRYASRAGTRLTGIQRAATIPEMRYVEDQNGFFTRGARKFVIEWERWVRARDIWVQELPLYQLYVVPISIPYSGVVNDASDLVEWVQIMRPGGDETVTEWVRYNVVADRRHLVRAEQPAWERLRAQLTAQTALDEIGVPRGGRDVADVVNAELNPYTVPYDDGQRRIGFIEPIEIEFPAIYEARAALGFRGDPFTGTSSHPHSASTTILPVHRFEFDWPGYGISAARAGRDDRVALVQGTRREDGQVPAVEWHTVNWAVRHYAWDQVEAESTTGRQRNSNRERRGDWPFQLVAFKSPVRTPFIGGADDSREELRDMRVVDRMVKFPSGELPAVDAEHALIGRALHEDLPPMRGIVDEIGVVARMTLARPLDQKIDEGADQFFVYPNATPTAVGAMVNAKPRQWADWGERERFSEHGGLLMVDREIMAYEAYDPQRGEFRVAKGGRGLLGTEARAHDEGAIVMFLEQVPAAILTGGLNESDYELEVQNLGGLPLHGALVLLGRELVHYTWTRGETTLAMPAWRDPEREGSAMRGLFRGRFGTVPTSAQSGEPVIWFPCRYWDRFRPRADDPELAYFQTTLDQGPVWFDSFGWKEDEQDPLVDVHCYVRLDERGSFADDPAQSPGLFWFTDGAVGDQANPIHSAASRLEARFVTVYRSGAFDPVEFVLQSWKKSPAIEWFALTYEGEGRIVSERISAR